MSTFPSQDSFDQAKTVEELYQCYHGYALSVRMVREETVSEEMLYLRRFFAYLGSSDKVSDIFNQITRERLTEFLLEYARTHPPGSRRWMQLSLRSFLRFAYYNSYMNTELSALIPAVRKFRMGHLPRALPDECAALLLQGIKPSIPPGRRDLAIVSLLSTYGVRGVQLRRLRVDHIDWSEKRISFPPAKGGKWISQTLTSEVGGYLADYMMNERPKTDLAEVFLTVKKNEPFSTASRLSSVIRRHIQRLDIKIPDGVSLGTHGFRHAFASRFVSHAPFEVITDMLGHRDPAICFLFASLFYSPKTITPNFRGSFP